MDTRSRAYNSQVLSRTTLSPELVRLTLGGAGLSGFASTDLPDEWVGVILPGQFESRFYSVRSWRDGVLTIDVVVHDRGLVTGWAVGDCVGDEVGITPAKGSFSPPGDAGWVLLVGDLTALPAMARTSEELGGTLPVRVWAEAPAPVLGYFPPGTDVTWTKPADDGSSRLAELVEGIEWPDGPGYFWMAGESSQMRAIRKFLMRVRELPHSAYDVMGYWRAASRKR